MSGTRSAAVAGVKRKREAGKPERRTTKSRSHQTASTKDVEDPQANILRFESEILESRKNYNNIAVLIQFSKSEENESETSILAVVALCRVFTRLLSTGDMVKNKGMAEAEKMIVSWLRERYREYTQVLLDHFLRSEHAPKQSVALTLLLRLLKEESKAQKDFSLKSSMLPQIVEALLLQQEDNVARDEFAAKYFGTFDDIRYYTFRTIKSLLQSGLKNENLQRAASNSMSLLLNLERVPSGKKDITNFYAEVQGKVPVPSMAAYKSQAQEAWLATLRSGLSKDQRKSILSVFSHQIAPWFQQPEMLMDFLTDSFDVGGATSLLALSGLYYLISEKNLDYPSFYQKLYSLLDEGLLHSKHRSRFFRLLDTFMASTHLPATLVASFIKRLSRLALHAPPAGIVVVVPWVYNMFMRHPACTFMMHREVRDPEWKKELEEEGMEDPFDMDEQDPLLTNAIESSVWELEALQSHYHPNVATLARIISEQFTKRSYNLEDFLDLSYNALLDTELNRDLKKDPEVEFEIPKRIFTTEDGLDILGQLWMQVHDSTG